MGKINTIKKKKKILPLKIFKNIKKVIKYYFKNFFYIIAMNSIAVFLFWRFWRPSFHAFVARFAKPGLFYDIFYYAIVLIPVSVVKIILYGNTVYVMKLNGKNDLKNLILLLVKRFFPVLATVLLYLIVVFVLTCFGGIPGIMFFFYYHFSSYLTAVGDINYKNIKQEMKTAKIEEIRILQAGQALGRSFDLVKSNLIRLIFLTAIFVLVMSLSQIGLVWAIKYVIRNFNYIPSTAIFTTLKFCLYDIIYLYSAFLFVRFEDMEKDVLEEEKEKLENEKRLLDKASVNKFKGAKK
jgi:hypothetical protein